jgi:hypothetical protein
MIESQDRRAPGVNRVSVARVVDICGRDATVPAFEAESIELSGRGMHVRTPYLPPLGAPLVCRLEDNGREIVVEGMVAWQRDCEGGGEFGVQFTALDSGSVEALKSLCGLSEPEARKAVPTPEPSVEPALVGMAVKLHIDGLGAPMKARVRKGGSRRLQVGSNLEFLKVGRGLQVEDVDQGQRRGARIDAVSIAIDPQTQVPQLVVALRYEGEDATPEPSVVGDEVSEIAVPVPPNKVAMLSEAKASPAVEAESDGEDEDDVDPSAMRGPVDAIAVSIGRAAQATGEKLAVASGSAATVLMRWAKVGGTKLGEAAARRVAGSPKRRSTAPAPQVPAPNPGRRLRPQNPEREPAAGGKARRRKLVAVVGVLTVFGAAGAMVLPHRSSKSGASSDAASHGEASRESAVMSPVPMAATTPTAAPVQAGPAAGQPLAPPAQTAVAMQSQSAAPMPGAPAAPPGPRPGVVANVPLFGPTPMATLEPAPLGPSPDEIGAAAGATAPRATEERMDDDEPRSSAHDEVFDDSSSGKKPDEKKSDEDRSAEAKAEAVKPWGTGKLYLPVIHRMKLDRPGIGLEGKKEMGGFSVELPGRRVLEGGAAIPKRDDRIAEVRTKNGPTGARVTFVFRSKIPTYKVRLRKNYVEFFISSPETTK